MKLGPWIKLRCRTVVDLNSIGLINRTALFIIQQGGITCWAIDEPRKSSIAIDKRVIIDFHNKNALIAGFRDKNDFFIFMTKCHDMA